MTLSCRIRVSALTCSLFLMSASVLAQEVFPVPRVFPDGRVLKASGDVDGDGDQDILRAVSFFGPELVLDLNNGSGQFTAGIALIVPPLLPQGPSVLVDITGDGLLDAVVSGGPNATSGAGGQLIVAPGDGLGGFSSWSAFPLPGGVTGLGVGDGDGDGRDDLLVRYATSPTNLTTVNLQWFLTRTSGAPQIGPSVTAQALSRLRPRIETADIDGDGTADFALRDMALPIPSVRVYLTQAGGALSPAAVLPLSASLNNPNGGALLSDADNDGDVDVLAYASNTTTLAIQVWNNDGLGAFPGGSLQSQPLTYGRDLQCFAGDWDGDGDDDLMYRGTGLLAANRPGGYNIFENDGTGTFTQRWAWPLGKLDFLGGPGFVDLNGDGNADFVGPEDMHVSPGSMSPPGNITPGDPNITLQGNYVFDADGDGDDDLISSSLLSFRANDGRGILSDSPETRISFPPSVPGFIYGRPYYIDWDQDGDMDAFSTLSAFNPVSNSYAFIQHERWRNDGGTTYQFVGPLLSDPSMFIPFETSSTVGSNNSPVRIDQLARDYDGDGLIDIISDQSIHFQQVSGPFTVGPGPQFPGWRALAAGDVDADGDQDIVASSLTGTPPQLAVLRNVGGANFVATPITSAISPYFYTIHLGDLDGDLDLDLVVTNTLAARTVQIVENTGIGFAAPITISLPSAPIFSTVSIQDLNLDGRADILLSRSLSFASLSDHTYVLLQSQTGPLSFEPLKIYALPSVSGVVDMDGDGDLDCTGMVTVFNSTIQGLGTGSRRQFGQGVAGATGLTPLLGATGPFRVGETGVLHLSGIPGGTFGIMSLGAQESNQVDFPFIGMTTYNAPWLALIPFTSPGTPGVFGAGDLQIPALFTPGLANTSTYIQIAFADSGAPLGFSATAGLELIVN